MKQRRTHQLTLTALMTALLSLVGPLTAPIGPVPVSFLSAGVMLTSLLLGPGYGTAAVGMYLLIGAVGLPVYSSFTGGMNALIGPTGGYLAGYLALAAICGWFASRTNNPAFRIGGCILGTAALYAIGTAWYCHQSGVHASAALSVCVWPFLPIDAVKIALAAPFATKLEQRLTKAGLM